MLVKGHNCVGSSLLEMVGIEHMEILIQLPCYLKFEIPQITGLESGVIW